MFRLSYFECILGIADTTESPVDIIVYYNIHLL